MKNTCKIWTSLFFALLISLSTYATQIDKTQAQQVAANFCHMENSLLELVYTSTTTGNNFYVFGHKNGFVIVAGDDRFGPILGYSNEGRPFLLPKAGDTTLGNNFWGLLKSYEEQIASGVEKNISATDKIASQWKSLQNIQNLKSSSLSSTAVVAPLLTTTWAQDFPYNSMCPSNVPAGCVAIAMAQILKYHNYPNQGLGSYGYTWGTYPYTAADFGATTYNWTNMPDKITSVNTDVATIIYHVAISCTSMWSPGSTSVGGSTSAEPMTTAFVNYFKMAYSSIRYVKKEDYTNVAWDNLIQAELLAKRPVCYRGDGVGSHAWVCDGVDANNMYHFNWGWGGYYNGYFSLSLIGPASFNYTSNQHAIIGIKPNDGSTLVANTTWSGTVSPTTRIAVPFAVTLTVNPGTTVKFPKDAELRVWGKVHAVGTNTNLVTFTAANTTDGWNGIDYKDDDGRKRMMTSVDSSKFVYARIEQSKSSGLYVNSFGKILVDKCKINDNESSNDGGGIRVVMESIHTINSEIYNNHATIRGGGIYLNSQSISATTISQNDIHDNVASLGGGFYLYSQANVVFENNIVYYNKAGNGAGGYLSGSITSKNNKICNNISSNNTISNGALYIKGSIYNPSIINTLIANNFAGGIYCENSSPNIFNTTVVNNSNKYASGIVFDENSDTKIKNCIIYGNIANNPEYGQQISIFNTNSDPIFDHCNIQGGLSSFGGPGAGSEYATSNYTNNIDILPQFVAPTTGVGATYDGLKANWQLQSSSPCINAGDITGIATLLPALDLAGNVRINGIIDMGPYEYTCTVVLSPNQPVGQISVTSSTITSTQYTTNVVANADTYLWELLPATAGSLSSDNTSLVTVTWNKNFKGTCTLKVKTGNACGTSIYSNALAIVVDFSTSIHEIEEYSLILYPNPCDGMFTITSDTPISTVSLYDVSGRLVHSSDTSFSKGAQNITMDYRDIPKGIYFARLSIDKTNVVRKVVIQ